MTIGYRGLRLPILATVPMSLFTVKCVVPTLRRMPSTAIQSNAMLLRRSFTHCERTRERFVKYFASRSFSSTTSTQQATAAKSNATLPLSGTLVVALEQAIAGPFCTRQLADLGARVIKIERPGRGDFNRDHDTRVRGLCSHFVWTNRSKESLALDLKDPKDLAALKQLLARADVMVQNLAPGATERMGLGYETLKVEHPGLIVCDISGYGSTGPYRNKKSLRPPHPSRGWIPQHHWFT